MNYMIKLIKLFKASNEIYIDILKALENEYIKFNFKDNIYLNTQKSFFENFKKNFFSLLMISILIENKIDKKRIIAYGKIIFCLRAIVTATDNIIDNENKGVVHILNIPEITSKNIFNTMLHQQIINLELENLKISSSIFAKILEDIFFIAKSEGLRDLKLYNSYPSFEYIEKNIHEGIGGKLLELSLIIPILIEKNSKLNSYSKGLFEIGMALQALDDLTDIDEDSLNCKINLATAYISESKTTENYLKNTLERALQGFKIFENLSYPIDRNSALYILKKLFKIRGINKKYLNIFKTF